VEAEIFAQGLVFVFATEEAAALQSIGEPENLAPALHAI
jgi:hypothetical protein